MTQGGINETLLSALIEAGIPRNTAIALATMPGIQDLDRDTAAILIHLPTDASGRRLLYGLAGTDLGEGTDLREVFTYLQSSEGQQWVQVATQEQYLISQALQNYESTVQQYNFAEGDEQTELYALLQSYADVLDMDTTQGVPSTLPEFMKEKGYTPDTILYQTGFMFPSEGPQTAQARYWEFTPAGKEGVSPRAHAAEGAMAEETRRLYKKWLAEESARTGYRPEELTQGVPTMTQEQIQAAGQQRGQIMEGMPRVGRGVAGMGVSGAAGFGGPPPEGWFPEPSWDIYKQSIPRGLSPMRYQSYVENLYEDVVRDYQGSGQRDFGAFVQQYPFERRWGQLAPSERGEWSSKFRPRLRTLQ